MRYLVTFERSGNVFFGFIMVFKISHYFTGFFFLHTFIFAYTISMCCQEVFYLRDSYARRCFFNMKDFFQYTIFS